MIQKYNHIKQLEPKIFGIGMSKTGTTTLGKCFSILGLQPHKSADRYLKKHYQKTGDSTKLVRIAKKYRSFEDTPWYLVFKELDAAFPCSKFILTTRTSSMVHAKSSWAHGVRAGLREGEPNDEYLLNKINKYENHNHRVSDHFLDRPDDLLVVCWENGDGWNELCSFLKVPIPNEPFPHANKGKYHLEERVNVAFGPSKLRRGIVKLKYRINLICSELLRRLRLT